MNRLEALSFLQTAGFTKLARAAGRTEDDTPTGYGPSLDWAFAHYALLYPSAPSVLDEHELGFMSLLKATTLDLLTPTLCSYVDTQVDAPLTRTAGSQLCKQSLALQRDAWVKAAAYGYGGMAEVGGFSVVLDYNERDALETE